MSSYLEIAEISEVQKLLIEALVFIKVLEQELWYSKAFSGTDNKCYGKGIVELYGKSQG